MPAYRVHAAKGLGYVRLGGRQVYLGRAGTPESHAAYRRVVAEWLAAGKAPPPRSRPTPSALSVACLVDGYVAWARGHYGSASPGAADAVAVALRPLRELYGPTDAAAFTPAALRAVRARMVASGWCRATVNKRVALVRRTFRWAAREELLPAAVWTALTAVEPLKRGRDGVREGRRVGPVPAGDVNLVLPYLTPTLRAMVQIQWLTGMRSGELCRLRRRDLDRSRAVWIYRPGAHKTMHLGHERAIAIGPVAQHVLRRHLDGRGPEDFVFHVPRRGKGGTVVAAHPARGAELYTPRSYHKALRRAMRRAARDGRLAPCRFWHPHQLRHALAQRVRDALGLEAARAVLGHRSVAATEHYSDVSIGRATRVALELG